MYLLLLGTIITWFNMMYITHSIAMTQITYKPEIQLIKYTQYLVLMA